MTDRRAPRLGEHGLSLIEALVMLAVSAMIALLLLPMTGRTLLANYTRAESSMDAASRARGEEQFRALLHAAVQPRPENGLPKSTLAGDARALVITLEAAQPVACAPARGHAEVTLRIIAAGAGGRMVCEADGVQASLLEWSSGVGAFAFSQDGEGWRGQWPATVGADASEVAWVAAPLARFTLTTSDQPQLAWITRAGATAPLEDSSAATSEGL